MFAAARIAPIVQVLPEEGTPQKYTSVHPSGISIADSVPKLKIGCSAAEKLFSFKTFSRACSSGITSYRSDNVIPAVYNSPLVLAFMFFLSRLMM